jgi:hypothetical protein
LVLAGVLSIRSTKKSADHPSRVGMMAVMMPGDGAHGHENKVYQVAGCGVELEFVVDSIGGFVLGAL